jgi:2,3-bisphosphoglycerate-independent phosphoglycerate mutase
MESFGQYRVMVATDHYTPISVKTHTTEPIPFAICGTGIPSPASGWGGFTEENARKQALFVTEGYKLLERFLRHNLD